MNRLPTSGEGVGCALPAHRQRRAAPHFAAWLALCIAFAPAMLAPAGAQPVAKDPNPSDVLGPEEWKQVTQACDRSLAWMAAQQLPNGSFNRDMASGDPAITSLCVMAFLSRGHVPGQGVYGAQLDRAIDFVLACQQPNGLFALEPPPPDYYSGETSRSQAAGYNHPISGIMLGEVYGMTDPDRADRIRRAIERALDYTVDIQSKPREPAHQGGWRYATVRRGLDSDLSTTSWQLMFLRSASNAGFEIPAGYVDQALEYVKRCYRPEFGTFQYFASDTGERTRAHAGAGIVSLALGGQHNTPMAQSAAEWILRQDFRGYNTSPVRKDRYHYSMYYCTQGMYQMGGEHWRQFFPPLARTLLANQSRDGSWPPESGLDRDWGNAYTTALVVNALCLPLQLVPIYQR